MDINAFKNEMMFILIKYNHFNIIQNHQIKIKYSNTVFHYFQKIYNQVGVVILQQLIVNFFILNLNKISMEL
jgi:hypothetical protein